MSRGVLHLRLDARASGTVAYLTIDNRSKLKLDDLLRKIKVDSETRTIRVFTIAYGTEKETKEFAPYLEKISEATQAKSYKSNPADILKAFKDIATFF